jgi:hypothetical protein
MNRKEVAKMARLLIGDIDPEELSKRTYGKLDRGLQADEVRKFLFDLLEQNAKLLENLEEAFPKMPPHLARKKVLARIFHLSVLLTQLRNASRISEAVEAVMFWLETNRTRLMVRVRKRGYITRKGKEKGKKPQPVYRRMFIPEEIIDYRELLQEYVKDTPLEKLTNRVKAWTKLTFQAFSTHALRYAKITDLVVKGYNPALIAKVTKHKTLDLLIEYTQEREAEEILEREW